MWFDCASAWALLADRSAGSSPPTLCEGSIDRAGMRRASFSAPDLSSPAQDQPPTERSTVCRRDTAPAGPMAPRPWNEPIRVQYLRTLDVLDKAGNEALNQIVQLAGSLLNVTSAAVHLIDKDRVWLKALAGPQFAPQNGQRESFFCSWTIASNNGNSHSILVVEDAAADPRFCDLPQVTGPPFVRFYAGAPLVAANGLHLGTLCVIDLQPRQLDAGACNLLANLASLVARQLEAPALAEFEKQVDAGELLMGRCDGDACAFAMARPLS